MAPDIAARIETWLEHCSDPSRDPLPGMREAGLLEPLDSYAAIARVKAALVEWTGLPGVAGVWGGRQLIGRFFIDQFGDAEQRRAWHGRAASVAISEPNVGAHPKLLSTRAEQDADGFLISGEKAWVSNGPLADVIIVLAITALDGDRKRYGAFLVPREAPGLTLREMPGFHALQPSRHCATVLDRVRVPQSALLGPAGEAYERMALPFRDVEDAVGTFTTLGAMRFLLPRLSATDDDAALSRGALAALAAVYADGAEAVVAPLDVDQPQDKSATLVGLRVLGADWLQRARAHHEHHGARDEAAVRQLLADLDAGLSVARGPRLARQARLGRVAG